MASPLHCPLRFAPIYQYRLWGGRRLEEFLSEPLPDEGLIGEAWLLSDRDDFPSLVAEGEFAGMSLKQLKQEDPIGLFGRFATEIDRYPLLLKLLDAREMLSVQVHPTDSHKDLLPPGERGKTEAWVVLAAEPSSSILAGLQSGTTADDLRHLTSQSSAAHLASFTPDVGDTIFLEAGTVHALGGGVLVFEVQQNSDVTFRLFDWDRVDAKTGKSRELHIEQALACIDYGRGPLSASVPTILPDGREQLVKCEFFNLWRRKTHSSVTVSAPDEPRVLYVESGSGQLQALGREWPVQPGQIFCLPAALGPTEFVPNGEVQLFEVGLN